MFTCLKTTLPCHDSHLAHFVIMVMVELQSASWNNGGDLYKFHEIYSDIPIHSSVQAF